MVTIRYKQASLILGFLITCGIFGHLYLLEVRNVAQPQHMVDVESTEFRPWARQHYGLNYNYERENATFVTLARNEELSKLLPTIENMQEKFNDKFNYDWVFLNDQDFTEEFKFEVQQRVTGEAKFMTIPSDYWGYPDYIDLEKAAQGRQDLVDKGIIYGGSESYRHMCRFESGFFFKTELMQQYRFYWRVEPETRLSCDVDYDPFKLMRTQDIKYGWTLSLREFVQTIPSLWSTTKDFLANHTDYVHPNNLAAFVTGDDMQDYNLCHFWSNFEIADMNFWRGEAYQEYFKFLDESGNFFYERWGDAPVHSIAASLFLDKDQIWHFDDIGYSHPPFGHCPPRQQERGLVCDCINLDDSPASNENFDWHPSSCLSVYKKARENDSNKQARRAK